MNPSPGESWAGAESECWPRGGLGSRPDPAACLVAWRDVWPSARWRLRGTLGVSGGVLIIIIADRNTGARRRWGSPESPWTPETPNQSPDQTPALPAALLRTLPSRARCRHADWGPGQGASWGQSPGATVGQRASPKGCPENIRVPFLGLPAPPGGSRAKSSISRERWAPLGSGHASWLAVTTDRMPPSWEGGPASWPRGLPNQAPACASWSAPDRDRGGPAGSLGLAGTRDQTAAPQTAEQSWPPPGV